MGLLLRFEGLARRERERESCSRLAEERGAGRRRTSVRRKLSGKLLAIANKRDCGDACVATAAAATRDEADGLG